MNKLHAMTVFVQVVQSGGFSRAADNLQIPRATVSSLIQQLEASLGVKLLLRTTRQVNLTAEGAGYYEHCVRLLADLSAVEETLTHARMRPSGRIRVDTSSSLAQNVIIPALSDFVARYPDITLELACGDRLADMVEEGIDCAVRFGMSTDPALIARRLGVLGFVTAAAPSYLAKHGRPLHPNDLTAHHCINYFSSASGRVIPWDFSHGGERIELPVPGVLAVNDASSYVSAGVAGLGVVHMPAFLLDSVYASGRLELLLQGWRSDPLPLYVVYPQHRHLSGKVRAFVEWIIDLFSRRPDMGRGGVAPPQQPGGRANGPMPA